MNLSLSWTEFKVFINRGYAFFEELLDANRYLLRTHPNGDKITTVIFKVTPRSSDQADYEDNFQAGKAASIADTMTGQNLKVFTTEALAAGTYEDSLLMECAASNKNYNLHNTHGTNALKFKLWGSPDNSDWEEILGETTLAAGAKVSCVNNDFWRFTKISAKGDVGASEITCYVQVEP